ncbi:MAG: hypothetical protein HAW61_05710 [Candidatus Portiera sp.]|nr:hypothetical protein [Portiera sp.]
MLKLTQLGEIFTAVYGISLEYNKMIEAKNGIPFVSRTSKNNGVVGYVERVADIRPNPAMTISLSASGSVMESFLQEEEYYSGRDLYYLKPCTKLSKNQMLYYCMILRANKYRYSYGRQANKTLDTIKIPVPDSIPNYVNRTQFTPPSNQAISKNKMTLADREWRKFKYSDLFKISGTKTTTLDDLNIYGKGKYPYVTTQSVENGVEGFFNHTTENGNVICIDSAVKGYCSYQITDFTASDHVEKLEISMQSLNQYVAMFLVTLANREQYRYSYGRKRSHERLRNEYIKLPVDKENKPDWKFMEEYIKSLPYSSNLVAIGKEDRRS